VAFSPDGQRIITGSSDQTAKIWEEASGRELVTLKGHSAAIWSVAFSSDGQRIVTGSSDRTAKVWEAASGRERLTLKGLPSAPVSSGPFPLTVSELSPEVTIRLPAKVWEASAAGNCSLPSGAQW
jgi:WD40 repeat protein